MKEITLKHQNYNILLFLQLKKKFKIIVDKLVTPMKTAK